MNWKCRVSVRVSLIWRWVSSFSDFHTPLYFPEEAAVYRRPQVSTNDTTIHFPFRSENHITLKRPPLFCCTLGARWLLFSRRQKVGSRQQGAEKTSSRATVASTHTASCFVLLFIRRTNHANRLQSQMQAQVFAWTVVSHWHASIPQPLFCVHLTALLQPWVITKISHNVKEQQQTLWLAFRGTLIRLLFPCEETLCVILTQSMCHLFWSSVLGIWSSHLQPIWARGFSTP